MFIVSALLLDDAFKPATSLTNGVMNESVLSVMRKHVVSVFPLTFASNLWNGLT